MFISGDIFIPGNVHERQLIRSIWYVRSSFPQVQHEHIMPSGVAELIFSFSDTVSFFRGSEASTTLPRCFLNGVNTSDFTVVKNRGEHFVGLQLYPFAIKALLGLPASELTNGVVDLTLIHSGLHTLWHKLAECNDFDDQVAILLNWFNAALSKKKANTDILRIGHLYNAGNMQSAAIRKIADQYSLSERTLRRKCNELLGMNTEAFMLYRKYMGALELLHNEKFSLTDIGNRSGYYDQSHFIREFKSFTSLTPGEYRQQKSFVPGHIYRFV